MRFARILIIAAALVPVSRAASDTSQEPVSEEAPDRAGQYIAQACADIWSRKSVDDLTEKSRDLTIRLDNMRRALLERYDNALKDVADTQQTVDDITRQIDRVLADVLSDAQRTGVEVYPGNIFNNPAALDQLAFAGSKAAELQQLEQRLSAANRAAQKAQAWAYLSLFNIDVVQQMRTALTSCVENQRSYLESAPRSASVPPPASADGSLAGEWHYESSQVLVATLTLKGGPREYTGTWDWNAGLGANGTGISVHEVDQGIFEGSATIAAVNTQLKLSLSPDGKTMTVHWRNPNGQSGEYIFTRTE